MEQTFLVVGYRQTRYAVAVQAVREVVWLPALAPFQELPPHIVGVFNLRGRIVPVLDLGARFGFERRPARLQDQVVVVEDGPHCLGLLVNELHDVSAVPSDAIEPVGHFQLPGGQTRFLRGVVKGDDGLLMLLDLSALLQLAADLGPLGSEAEPCDTLPLASEEDEIFRARARQLAQLPEQPTQAHQLSYALIRLDGEGFGLEVGAVREFVRLHGLTPIPCSPPHLAGNMNLRGDILTVVDVRPLLGLRTLASPTDVVVMAMDELVFGLLVEGVEDVFSVAAASVTPQPRPDAYPDALCPGVVMHGDQAVSLIDSHQLIASLLARRQPSVPASRFS